jgi:outer membrane protein assembly factor BamB
MKIHESRRGQLPRVSAPVPFASPDSRIRGWKVTLPGGHPLATPAVVAGRVFLGGGFGSYEFYALDAASGEVLWQYQTTDDGPTAAVVADERVVFNTESCELEVLTVEGRPVWKHWLGDPLLSMPAVEEGRVFMAYPDSRGDRRHYLACFELANGHEVWRHPVAGEVITCPVLADGQVYLANLDGTLACFRQTDGMALWQEARNASSAPVVWRRQCYFSQRTEASPGPGTQASPQQMEQLASKLAAAGTPSESFPATARTADYLDHEKRARRSPHYAQHALYDMGVGFANSKGDAKINQAMRNLGTAHVSGVWAFQGSKSFVSRGRLFSGLGDTVHCVEPESREVFWKKGVREGAAASEELLDSHLTPPVLVNQKLIVGTLDGRVLCLSAATGETLWSVSVGEAVVFQPAVAQGRVYVPTAAGSLFCLETGDPADDGWLMWGATAAHNGRPEDLI